MSAPHIEHQREIALFRYGVIAELVQWPEETKAEPVRKVQKDRTVSLNGLVYEVDAPLVGENVTLRFDPGTSYQSLCQLLRQGRSPLADLGRRGTRTRAAGLGPAPA